MTTDQTTAGRPEPDTAPPPPGKGRAIVATAIGIGLGLVIAAPIALSSQDLVAWARADTGLGASGPWPVIVFIALDLAAAVCVGMVVYAAFWRAERGGAFRYLVWLFAGASAFANYKHGKVTPAPDDEWFYPAMSLAGPLLLEVTIGRIRRWTRADAGSEAPPLPGFGFAWLPGVGFKETLSAWAAAARHGIAKREEALAFVRERKALVSMAPVDALHYAFGALGGYDPHAARVWLSARGVVVDQAAIEAATVGRPASPLPIPVSPAGPSVPVGSGPTDTEPQHRAALDGLDSKRAKIRYALSVLGRYDAPAAQAWLKEHGTDVHRSEIYAVIKQAGDTGAHQVLPLHRVG